MKMKRVAFQLEEGDAEIIALLDQIMAVQSACNRLGEGDWSWLATGKEDHPYGMAETMFRQIAMQLFGHDSERAYRLRDLCIDNGESPSWNINNNADIIVGLDR